VRKLINWLTVKTGEGDLFEIDTALRPNGHSGLLVSSFESYARYLRYSALTDACKALAVLFFAGVWSRRYSVASIGQRGSQSGDAGCAGNCGTPAIVGRARLDRASLPGA